MPNSGRRDWRGTYNCAASPVDAPIMRGKGPMPRYELSEESSNKLWEIELEGTSYRTTYGKIGTDGQTTLKQFGSEAEAKKEYDKSVAEKTKKGYELIAGSASASK